VIWEVFERGRGGGREEYYRRTSLRDGAEIVFRRFLEEYLHY